MATSTPARRLDALLHQLKNQHPRRAEAEGSDSSGDSSEVYDVLIVGAGFAGLYAIHKLRQQGLKLSVSPLLSLSPIPDTDTAHSGCLNKLLVSAEPGTGIGKSIHTRYPGARCDVPSVEYSYSFSPEVEAEWEWTECMAGQPEIERYANYVADKFDLRKDITLNTKVTDMRFDESTETWDVSASDGVRRIAQFVMTAVGCLSHPSEPDAYHDAVANFGGPVYMTGRWPEEEPDFRGKRVGVVGTGSSGIQAIPVIAESAAKLTVFQRTPQFTIPANNHPLDKEYLRRCRERYPAIREAERKSNIGIALVTNLGGTIHDPAAPLPVSSKEAVAVLDLTQQERTERSKRLGFEAIRNLSDTRLDMKANELACEMFREHLFRVVKDPAVAAALMPTGTPLGCKRQVIDTNYYDTYNRPNVKLVDLRKGGIERVTTNGIVLEGGDNFELDAIVFATGFDALSGPLLALNPVGRGGQTLAQKWAEGPKTYLGIQIAGFPNLFTVTGPGSPSVLSNMIVSIEQHVDWIAECIAHTRQRKSRVVEATRQAEEEWVMEVNQVAEQGLGGIIFTHPTCSSWYLGANIPGKPRVFMPYAGGLGKYRDIMDGVTKTGYPGFAFS